MNEEKLKKVLNILELADKDYATTDEVAQVINAVLDGITSLRKDLTEKINEVESNTSQGDREILSTLRETESKLKDSLSALEKTQDKRITKLNNDLLDEISNLKDLIPTLPDLAPIEKRLTAVEDRKMPDIPEVPKDLVNEEQLLKEIHDLREELDQKISKIPRGGGGVSALGVRQAFKYIFHTEQPVGSINGSNTTYTVKNDIWAIIGFTLNGESIAELPNFTFSRGTITFASAIPASYSGKDWEIKYIG